MSRFDFEFRFHGGRQAAKIALSTTAPREPLLQLVTEDRRAEWLAAELERVFAVRSAPTTLRLDNGR
ncbi:hypothetical protein ACFZC5_36325 [Nocardia gamkensis]|uniref:hypothetical protein n=1 Tax=Nocardia gamkensis TaxID=352869 RepID=UPI0036EBDDD5